MFTAGHARTLVLRFAVPTSADLESIQTAMMDCQCSVSLEFIEF